jgi:hypothetical protein
VAPDAVARTNAVAAPVVTPVPKAKTPAVPAQAETKAAPAAPAAAPKAPETSQVFSEFYLSIKNTPMDKIVDKFLSRPDGLNHLLLTDVNHLMTKINNEFPMITRYYSIG